MMSDLIEEKVNASQTKTLLKSEDAVHLNEP